MKRLLEDIQGNKSTQQFKPGKIDPQDLETLEALGKSLKNPDRLATGIQALLARKDGKIS